MTNTKTGRMVSQENWKRTQVRMPQEQYADLVKYAKDQDVSLNSAMIDLMNKGLKIATAFDPINTKFINLKQNVIRLVYGELLYMFDLDLNKNLDELKIEIENLLKAIRQSEAKYFSDVLESRDIYVYEGEGYIDIADRNTGSMEWLTIEDHLIF